MAGGSKTLNGITIDAEIDEKKNGGLKGIITCDSKECKKNETEFGICICEKALLVPKSLEKQMLAYVNSIEG
ncbi:MAG: hypothetical protein WC506_05690 [Candidatus Micrarchaeia archaeon]